MALRTPAGALARRRAAVLLLSIAALGGARPGFCEERERSDLLAPDFRFFVDGRERAVPDWLRELAVRGRFEGAAESSDTEPWECEVLPARPSSRLPQPATLEAGAKKAPAPVPAGVFGARVLVESDFAFFLKWGGSVDAVTAKILDILAEVDGILEREVGVRLEIGHIGVSTDPATPPVRWSEYLAAHPIASFPRALIHFFNADGRAVAAGLGGICTGYGKTPYDLSTAPHNPLVVAHEIGHLLGSDHTHCYGYPTPYDGSATVSPWRGPIGLPPVDRCASEETCYQGVTVPQPVGESSIMSYCGSIARSYGEPGRYGDRSERVLAVMRVNVERADALYPGCLRTLTDALRLRVVAATGGSATLAWDDIFPDETGWTVERFDGKKWTAIRRVGAKVTKVKVNGVASGGKFRVFARFKGNVSEPSVPVTMP